MAPLSDGSAHEPRPATVDAPVAPLVDVSAVEGSGADVSSSEVPVEEEPRRYPSTIGGACYLALLGVSVLAMVVIGLGHWRGGVHILGVVMVAASVLRGCLPRRDAGMLAVRSRWFDVTLLGATGIALWVLASTVPNQV